MASKTRRMPRASQVAFAKAWVERQGIEAQTVDVSALIDGSLSYEENIKNLKKTLKLGGRSKKKPTRTMTASECDVSIGNYQAGYNGIEKKRACACGDPDACEDIAAKKKKVKKPKKGIKMTTKRAKRVDKRVVGATYRMGQCMVRTVAYMKLDGKGYANLKGYDISEYVTTMYKMLLSDGSMKPLPKTPTRDALALVCTVGMVSLIPVNKSGNRAGGHLGFGFSDKPSSKAEGAIIMVTEDHYTAAKQVFNKLKSGTMADLKKLAAKDKAEDDRKIRLMELRDKLVYQRGVYIIPAERGGDPKKWAALQKTRRGMRKPSPAKKPVKKPVKKPAKKPVKKPVKKPAKKPVKKPVKKPAKKPVKKPVKKPAKKPVKKVSKRKPAKKPKACVVVKVGAYTRKCPTKRRK